MTAYIIRRLIQALIVIILVAIGVFFVLRQLPGDPILLYIPQDQYRNATPEELDEVRHEVGLDRPAVSQFVDWVKGVLHGDLGQSMSRRKPVSETIRIALPMSLHLGILSFIISTVLGIFVGVVCAVRRGKWIDTVLTVLANLGITAPTFWVGILLIYIFGLWLGWLPLHGYTPPLDDFWLGTKQLIMPVFCLSLFPLAASARFTRSTMLEVIRQDYVRTAWSKGLKEGTVIFRHALKNGLLPVVTMVGMSLGFIVSGQVLVESVFGIPGMGSLAVTALLDRDYVVVQGIVLVVGIVVVLSNLLVDISYGWLDPKVTYE